MNIEERLKQTDQKLQDIQLQLQQLEQTKQELLQEFLRLDGEHRLLQKLIEQESK